MNRHPPRSTLFPYPPLFRSLATLKDERERVLIPGFYDRVREPSPRQRELLAALDRKSTRLNSSHQIISHAVFCFKKKKTKIDYILTTNITSRHVTHFLGRRH